jgi:short-subunit dehydrogenase
MQKVVLITGITSGFGEKTAGLLAAKGYRVYGTSRKAVDSAKPYSVLQMEVTDPSSVKIAVDKIIGLEGRIDVLINNAGMGISGPVETTPADEIRLQMDTNFMGFVNTIQQVVPVMRSQGAGIIINMSSIGGLMGLPYQGFYSASKFAVEGLSEALRMELKPYNIKVVLVNPGDFKTHFTANRKVNTSVVSGTGYEEQFRESLAVIEKDENGGLNPEILARKIARILERKNPCHQYVVATFEQKLAVLIKTILPGSWFMKILSSHYGIK